MKKRGRNKNNQKTELDEEGKAERQRTFLTHGIPVFELMAALRRRQSAGSSVR